MGVREDRKKGKSSVKVGTVSTRIVVKEKTALLSTGGPKQHSCSLISPALHERLREGPGLVHKIIKSLMRLKDKSGKERVQHLALGMLASSIFQWKSSLGQESAFTLTTTTATPALMRDHSTHVFNPNTQPGCQENHDVAAVLDQWSGAVFLSVVQNTGALNSSAALSLTFSRWPAPSTLSSNDSYPLVNLIRDYQDTAVINWKLSSESHIKSQPWGK